MHTANATSGDDMTLGSKWSSSAHHSHQCLPLPMAPAPITPLSCGTMIITQCPPLTLAIASNDPSLAPMRRHHDNPLRKRYPQSIAYPRLMTTFLHTSPPRRAPSIQLDPSHKTSQWGVWFITHASSAKRGSHYALAALVSLPYQASGNSL